MFEKYVNMIRKLAWKYANKFRIDYEELESEGFVIYCECLEGYDERKGKFSTYLYNSLNMKLGNYCRLHMIHNKAEFYDNDMLSLFSSCDSELFDVSLYADYLSKSAYELVKWILSMEWQKFKRNEQKPTITTACRHFKKSREQMKKTFEEVSVFWNEIGYAL